MDKPLRIKMLGAFSVYYGDAVVVSEYSRESKAIHLLQFLLMRRGRPVPQEELINTFLADDDSLNPQNALKNLIYRVRKMFDSAGVTGFDHISCRNGAYTLSADLLCKIDAEEFEQAVEAARVAPEEDEKALWLKAASLYGGDFLPRSSWQTWVVPQMVRYQDMYMQAVRSCWRCFDAAGEYTEVLPIITRAVELHPYSEELRMLRILCLYRMRRVKDAIVEYDASTTMLFDELGIAPSKEMQELYQTISTGEDNVAGGVEEIIEEMREEIPGQGAYFCNYQVFSNTYRFVVRHIERNGRSAFVVLCTLTEEDGSMPSGSDRIRELSTAFHRTIKTSLRRGDIYTRYGPSQFLLLLMDINVENCKLVMGRISVNFRTCLRDRKVRLVCKMASASSAAYAASGDRPADTRWS